MTFGVNFLHFIQNLNMSLNLIQTQWILVKPLRSNSSRKPIKISSISFKNKPRAFHKLLSLFFLPLKTYSFSRSIKEWKLRVDACNETWKLNLEKFFAKEAQWKFPVSRLKVSFRMPVILVGGNFSKVPETLSTPFVVITERERNSRSIMTFTLVFKRRHTKRWILNWL